MSYDAIDSAYLAVPDLVAAGRPCERLGLGLPPGRGGRGRAVARLWRAGR